MSRRINLEKIKIKRIVLVILGILILVLISFPVFENMDQRNEIDTEMEELENEILRLHTKNEDLKNAIEYLESDQFTEEQARFSLGLKKRGEDVVVVKKEEMTSDSREVLENFADKSNAEKWWSYFFDQI